MDTKRFSIRIMTVALIWFCMLSAASATTANQPAKSNDSIVNDGPAAHGTGPDLQSRSKEPVFHHLTIDDGLSDNSVYDVRQDR
jgi:hypothetical protein